MSSDLTLAVDGSTYAGSVAVIRGHDVIAERQLSNVAKPGRGGLEELFMPMVADCLRDGKVAAADLARIVCGEGPGSFTSLRIAASIAKGIAAGRGIPLYAVSSLLLVVAGNRVNEGRFIAALPAMRGEVFVARIDVAVNAVRQVGDPRIVLESDLADEAASTGAEVIGPLDGSDKLPHARGAARVLDQLIKSSPCDIEGWEPLYGRLAEAQVKWEAAHGRPLA